MINIWFAVMKTEVLDSLIFTLKLLPGSQIAILTTLNPSVLVKLNQNHVNQTMNMIKIKKLINNSAAQSSW